MPSHHRLRALLATTAAGALAATGLVIAIAGPASADSTVSWRPESTPSNVGLWSNTCTSDLASPPSGQESHTKLADNAANVGSAQLVAGEDSGTAWQFPTSSSTEIGPSTNFDKSLTGVALRVNGTVNGRVVAAFGDYYGVAKISSTATGWHTIDLTSTNLSWYKWNPGLLGLLKGYYSTTWSGSNQHTLANFATTKLGSSSAMLAVQVGCGSTPAVDQFAVTTSSGTTTYDLTNASSTSTLSASSSSVPGGTSVTLNMSVLDNYTKKAPSSGSVELQSAPSGSTTFSKVATVTPSTTSYSVKPAATTQYQLAYSGSTATAASTSSPITVAVTTGITAKASATYVLKGKTYTVTGSTTPAQSGQTVNLQQNVSGSWSTVATATTGSDGKYSFTRTASTSGNQSLRVILASSGATSPTVTVTTVINGKVTIKATPGKPRPGKKVTITGTVSPARATKVQIQRYKGKGWKTIGTATSNSKGHFTYKLKTAKPAVISLRATTASSGDIVAATSSTKTVVATAKTKTTARFRSHTATVNKAFHVTGTIRPKHKGVVYLEVLANHKWVAIAAKTTTRKGKYNIKATMPWTGVWKMRVLLAAALGYSGSHSGTSTFTVKAVSTPTTTTPTHTSSSSSGGSSGGSSGSGGVGHG